MCVTLSWTIPSVREDKKKSCLWQHIYDDFINLGTKGMAIERMNDRHHVQRLSHGPFPQHPRALPSLSLRSIGHLFPTAFFPKSTHMTLFCSVVPNLDLPCAAPANDLPP